MARRKTTTRRKTNSTAFNLVPAPGYLIIKPFEAETKTQSGIYLPDNASEEKPQRGEVIAVGEPETNEHGVVRRAKTKVGDKVIYKKWGGTEIKIDGQDFLFAKFDDILATEAS
jgi:chaperonin GroES